MQEAILIRCVRTFSFGWTSCLHVSDKQRDVSKDIGGRPRHTFSFGAIERSSLSRIER